MSSIYPLDYTIAKACICVRKLKKHFYSIKVQTKSDCTTNFVSADKKIRMHQSKKVVLLPESSAAESFLSS